LLGLYKEDKQETNRMLLYRDVLKKSFLIAWNHKYLWVFGVFAAMLGGVSRYSISFSSAPENWSGMIFSAVAVFFNNSLKTGTLFSNLGRLFETDPVAATIFITFFLIMGVFCLLLLWLAIVSEAGLINNAAKIIKSNGKKTMTTIQEGTAAGVKNFWPVLGYNLIGAGLTAFFAALVGLPLLFMSMRADITVALLYVLLFLIFIPLALIISLMVKYAVSFVVIRGEKFVDAFVEACWLFGKYWLISLEMALILFIIDCLYVVVVSMVLLVLAIPYIFAARILSLTFLAFLGVNNFFLWAAMAGLFAVLIIIVIAGAVITTFKTAAWTDVFLNLTEKRGSLAKLERLAAGWKK